MKVQVLAKIRSLSKSGEESKVKDVMTTAYGHHLGLL